MIKTICVNTLFIDLALDTQSVENNYICQTYKRTVVFPFQSNMTKAYLNRTLNTIFVATTLCALVTTIYKFFEVEGIEIFEHFFNINCISIALVVCRLRIQASKCTSYVRSKFTK